MVKSTSSHIIPQHSHEIGPCYGSSRSNKF